MQSHPAFAVLAPYVDQNPAQSGALYTTYTDICLSHQWKDVRILALRKEGWVVLFGRKALSDPIRLILPLAINTNSLTSAVLKAIFSALEGMDFDTLPEMLPPIVEAPEAGLVTGQAEEEESAENILDKETIYISIATPDSSVVYYKLAKGIKKPQDVPDE
ncbi:hypothetical protein NliqN6_0820 [Naganishia liquefaciens]|uniref:tRNA-splicing endonuclease subunit Sen15 domain-containing protein n=1 Tax=Naganishia liquefaciens TaxID=104408 RepID=A0A8H3TNS3_9TREE|nr:hypothetical protein NliqN6_0820 [Naganishia liquefaciens]